MDPFWYMNHLLLQGVANVFSDRVLMDGLYYEFCRYSNNVAVRLYGESDKKWAVVKYKRWVCV